MHIGSLRQWSKHTTSHRTIVSTAMWSVFCCVLCCFDHINKVLLIQSDYLPIFYNVPISTYSAGDVCILIHIETTFQWRHSDPDGVPNHCLLNRLFRQRWKKTSKHRATGFCAGNSPVTGEFPAQRASNAENDSIWWRHHETSTKDKQQSVTNLEQMCLSMW